MSLASNFVVWYILSGNCGQRTSPFSLQKGLEVVGAYLGPHIMQPHGTEGPNKLKVLTKIICHWSTAGTIINNKFLTTGLISDEHCMNDL